MLEISNTQISILRGQTVDAYGNKQDSGIAILTGVDACLVETSKTVMDRVSQTPRTVRTTTCVVPDWANVTTADQITDESSGSRYAIEDIVKPPTLIGAPVDIILTLRRVTAATA